MQRHLRATKGSWLVSHGQAAVYWCAVSVFWGYTTLTRVLVRGLWYQAMPSANMSSPKMFALAHAIFAPALFIAHSAAYRIGLPDSHRIAAAVRHLLVVFFVMCMAKFSFMALSAYAMLKSGQPGVLAELREWLTDPLTALGSAIELGSLYCVALAIAAGVVNWRRYHLEAIARSRLALDAERSRSMALRRQLDPHSLYNTLNAIAGSVRPAPMIAIEMLSSLGELLRMTLRDEVIDSTLNDEFAIAGRYLALYQLRYPEKLSFKVTLAESCGNAAIPALLLQPLVENAALHGVNSGLPAIEVLVHARKLSAERIEITISNSSTPDASLVSPQLSSGIGLRNTWERLLLSYGNQFSLNWVENAENKAILRLEIPRLIPKRSINDSPAALGCEPATTSLEPK